MAMRWPFNSPEKHIEAFIGAWGVKTGEIVDADQLLEMASRLFEVPNSGIAAGMAAAIDGLGKKERKRLAAKNMAEVMGSGGRVSGRSPVHPTQASLDRMMEDSQPEMVDGLPFGISGELDVNPAELLRKVVSAVISAGRADILWEFPEVLAFFGSRIPERHEVAHLHNVDERMFEARDRWPNAIKT